MRPCGAALRSSWLVAGPGSWWPPQCLDLAGGGLGPAVGGLHNARVADQKRLRTTGIDQAYVSRDKAKGARVYLPRQL